MQRDFIVTREVYNFMNLLPICGHTLNVSSFKVSVVICLLGHPHSPEIGSLAYDGHLAIYVKWKKKKKNPG